MTATSPRFPRARPPRLSPADIKALARHRDGYRCTECGMTAHEHLRVYRRTLDVHRVVPGTRYTVKGCVTLCKKCHKEKPKSPYRRGQKEILAARLSREMVATIDVLAQETYRTRPAMLMALLEEALTARGLWPPSA
jgi:hypothetical protein